MSNHSPERNFDQAYLKEILRYEPDNGHFFWRKLLSKRAVPGKKAGWSQNGYVCISIHGRYYRAHRLAWLYIYGEWPEYEIDHINGVPDDNRIENLRPATSCQNKMNAAIRSDNSSGFKGVQWNSQRKRWKAVIQKDGKVKHLGFYHDVEEAAAARATAEIKYFGEYRRTC